MSGDGNLVLSVFVIQKFTCTDTRLFSNKYFGPLTDLKPVRHQTIGNKIFLIYRNRKVHSDDYEIYNHEITFQ